MSDRTTLEHQRYRRGRVIVLVSGVVMSLSGPLVRLLEDATAWQFLFYRSIAVVVVIALLLALRGGARFVATFAEAGRAAVVGGICLAVAFTCIVFALLDTTIANALFLMCTAPFITAFLARFLLGERPSRTTWIAMLIAIVGVLVMVGEGILEGDLLGDLTALGAATGFACFSVSIRYGRSRDMVPSVGYAAAMSGIVAAVMIAVTGQGFAASANDVAASAAYGVVGIAGGLYLYTRGARDVPAAELNLPSLGEVVLSPLWVWIGFGEVPSAGTLVGGGILFAAIFFQALARTPTPAPVGCRDPLPP
jgi:drug/metabolite transporter (DMT)-like permease